VIALVLAVTLTAQAEARAQEFVMVAEPKGLSHVETLSPVLCQVADAASTIYALRQPGTYEGNPVMRSLTSKPAIFVSAKFVVGLGMSYTAHRLAKDGHRGWAKALSWGATISGCGLAVHNVMQGSR
jgi:hypothetical protein